jgi:hypothetical protein
VCLINWWFSLSLLQRNHISYRTPLSVRMPRSRVLYPKLVDLSWSRNSSINGTLILITFYEAANDFSLSCASWIQFTHFFNIDLNLLKPKTYCMYVPPALKFWSSTFCPHSVFMCFVWISKQTAMISLYRITLSVFITEAESDYCAVRTGSSDQTDILSSLKG